MEVIRNIPHNYYNVISTFSGCGGSSLGYKMAGYKVLWANEFIPAAQECYKVNHPTTFLNIKDIRKVQPEDILKEINYQEVDILDGSPPCASFSMAGKREKLWGKEKKYSDTTQRVDDLFFEYIRIVKGVQPKIFIAENVAGLTMGVAKNILGSNQFDMFNDQKDTILYQLENAGYKVDYMILNAKYFGVPQNRERIFIIGFRKDLNINEFDYPKSVKKKIAFEDIKEEKEVSVKYYLSTQYQDTLRNHKERHKNKGNGFGYEIIKDNQCANAIVVGGMGRERNIVIDCRLTDFKPITKIKGVVNRDGWRRMTPLEWARLQGFPDNYIIKVSDAQAYKQFGNSVAIPAIQATASNLIKRIIKEK